jgi:hypothetical protein
MISINHCLETFGSICFPRNSSRRYDQCLLDKRSDLYVTIEEPIMLGRHDVDVELKRSLGLSMKELRPLLAAGGDLAEKKFMECCWCLWKANGAELVEPLIDAAFNDLPEKSRSVLFQRMLTIVYIAQEIEIKKATEPVPD